jgi:predicted O-methyltransferase YrrM
MGQDILFQQLTNTAVSNLCDIYALCLRTYTGKKHLRTAVIGSDCSILNNSELFYDFGMTIDAFFEGIPGDVFHPSRPMEEITGNQFDLILLGTGDHQQDMRLLTKITDLGVRRGWIDTPIFSLPRIHLTAMAAVASLKEFPTCLNVRKMAMITLGVSLTAGAGCIVECGTFLGGTSLYIASLLREQQDERRLFAIDTFEGMPSPVSQDGETVFQSGTFTETTFDNVNALMQRHNVQDRVTLLKGLVQDRLPDIWREEDQVSFALVDTDQYAGTKSSLLEIVPRLSCNGIIVVDDYSVGGVREAVDEILAQFPELHGALISHNFYMLFKDTDFRFLSIWKS